MALTDQTANLAQGSVPTASFAQAGASAKATARGKATGLAFVTRLMPEKLATNAPMAFSKMVTTMTFAQLVINLVSISALVQARISALRAKRAT